MDPFCPACQSVFLGTPRCPRCGGDLGLPPEETAADASRTTPAGRVAVGGLAAVGLYLGLRELAAGWAGLSAGGPEWWLTPAFGAVAAVFGGLLAGVGQRGGFAVGAAVGGLCGAGFLFADGVPSNPVLYALPVASAALGGLAGVVGARVWAAPAAIALPVAAARSRGSSIQLLPGKPADGGRSGAWVRVLLGAATIVGGVAFADEARVKVQRNSAGLLRVDNGGQGRLVSL
ncbi:MAG: zinc ribbon domain-containing protein, partial [Gemmataceae bacterium]|nr:zinc ribbon domain-containing protein [Gemmataceae bacterium]